jgi:hypothetical protein
MMRSKVVKIRSHPRIKSKKNVKKRKRKREKKMIDLNKRSKKLRKRKKTDRKRIRRKITKRNLKILSQLMVKTATEASVIRNLLTAIKSLIVKPYLMAC